MTKQRNWEDPAVTVEWETAKRPPKQTARDRAIAHIQTVRDSWYPTPIPAGVELDAIPADLLQELHDEGLMVGERT